MQSSKKPFHTHENVTSCACIACPFAPKQRFFMKFYIKYPSIVTNWLSVLGNWHRRPHLIRAHILKGGKTDMVKLAQFIRNFHREESGQDMLEYAMVLAAVLAAVVAGSTTLSSTIAAELTTITGFITALKIP